MPFTVRLTCSPSDRGVGASARASKVCPPISLAECTDRLNDTYWFPPYPSSAGAGPNESPVPESIWRLGRMLKLMTVTRFGRILASWKIIPEAFLGYVFGMLPREVPRHPQSPQKVPKDLPKGTQRSPKGSLNSPKGPKAPPHAPKRCLKTSQMVPKGHRKGSTTHPNVPKDHPQVSQRLGGNT